MSPPSGVILSYSHLVISETAESLYELSLTEMHQIWEGMSTLSQSLTIWPDPRDLLMGGSKIFLESIISLAAISLDLKHPQAVHVQPSIKVVQDIVERRSAAVLKRDFSSHGHHVFSVHTKDAVEKFQSRIEEEEAVSASRFGPFPHPCWFIQPYNPALVYLGEIRAFVVNGCIFKQIVTALSPTGGPLDITEPNIFTPLSMLRLVPLIPGSLFSPIFL